MKKSRILISCLLILCMVSMMLPTALAAEDEAALMQASDTADEAVLMQASETTPDTAPAETPANSNNEIIIVTDDDTKTVQLGGSEVQLFVDAEPGNINFMDSAGTENNIPTGTHAEVTVPEDIQLQWLDVDNVFDGSPKLTVTADGGIHASDSNNELSQAYAVSVERAGDNKIGRAHV